MLNAFFDESGHERHESEPILVVAGLVGPPWAWDEFETLWRPSLERRHLDDFHANELDARWGPYKSYSSEDRDQLLKELVAALDGRNLFPFVSITDVVTRRAIRDAGFNLVENAWEQCAETAMRHVVNKFQMSKTLREMGESITFVFEQSSEFAGAGARAFEAIVAEFGADVICGFQMAPSTKVVQLHAVDFLSHEITVHEKRARAGKGERFFMREIRRLYPIIFSDPVMKAHFTVPERLIQKP